MSPRNPFRSVLLVLAHLAASAFCGLPFLLSAPAEAEQPVSSSFGEVIEVELVNVRVWVTDRDGRPVTGLGAEDFAVEVDGETVEITNFSESRRGASSIGTGTPGTGTPGTETPGTGTPGTGTPGTGTPGTGTPGTGTPGTGTPAPAEGAQGATAGESSRFIVYVDELHMSSLDRRRVIEDLGRLVADGALPPSEILILQQAEDLRRILPFGSSAEQVDAALEQLLESPGGGDRAPIAKNLAVQRIWQLWEEARQLSDRDPCQFFTRDAEREAVVYAQQASARGLLTLRHLEEASSFLAGLEGWKALLYVGDVLEIRPGEDLMEIVHGLCPQSREALPGDIASEQLSSRFDEVAQRANAGQVTFYTVQAGGLRTGAGFGPEQRNADLRVSGAFDRALRRSSRGGLEQLALQTGGEAMVNRNRFDQAFIEVAEDLESYYSLGFPPPEGAEGGRLRLDVEVRGEGLEVRHRDGIQLRSPREQLYENVMSAVHLGESENPLGVRLASGALRQQGKGVLTLPLYVRVPVEAVTFLPGSEGEAAELEVMVLARSPEHRGMPPAVRTYRLERPAAPAELLDLAMELQLAPGAYVIGVGVRDRLAGSRSFISTAIAVGPLGDDS